MKTEFNFTIYENKKISITIPDFKTKYNYFFKPTKKLHRSDETTAFFEGKDCKQIELEKDTLDEVTLSLSGTLKYILIDNLQLPNNIKPGAVGHALNEMLNDSIEDNFSRFWVWSCIASKSNTLIYQADNKIYLEIVPSYPWLFREHDLSDPTYITFEEFMKNYKPYVFETISRETAQQWVDQCEEILKIIDVNFERKKVTIK